jgi:hypothetical protein
MKSIKFDNKEIEYNVKLAGSGLANLNLLENEKKLTYNSSANVRNYTILFVEYLLTFKHQLLYLTQLQIINKKQQSVTIHGQAQDICIQIMKKF